MVSPYHLGGERIAHAVARPSVVDFITPGRAGRRAGGDQPRGGGGGTRLRAREPAGCSSFPARGLRLHIVAIKRAGEPTRFQPGGEDTLRAGDRIVVVGDAENLRRIAELAVGA